MFRQSRAAAAFGQRHRRWPSPHEELYTSVCEPVQAASLPGFTTIGPLGAAPASTHTISCAHAAATAFSICGNDESDLVLLALMYHQIKTGHKNMPTHVQMNRLQRNIRCRWPRTDVSESSRCILVTILAHLVFLVPEVVSGFGLVDPGVPHNRVEKALPLHRHRVPPRLVDHLQQQQLTAKMTSSVAESKTRQATGNAALTARRFSHGTCAQASARQSANGAALF